MTALRTVLVRSIAVGSVLAAALTFSPTGSGAFSAIREVLSERFDDEPLGAVPNDWNNETTGPLIDSKIGILANTSTHANAYLMVEPAPGDSGDDQILRMSDAEIPEGQGHSELEAYPGAYVGPGEVVIRFEVRPGKFYGESMTVSIIDNRTTPGTGRLVAFGISSTGELKTSGVPTGFFLLPAQDYQFKVGLSLVDGPYDSWDIRVSEVGSDASYYSRSLPLENDGGDLTKVVFSLSDSGWGSFDLDDLQIEAY